MIVSQSEVSCWQTCPRLYFYQYTLGLEPVKNKPAVDKGTSGHLLLDNFYKAVNAGMNKEEARESLKSLVIPATPSLLVAWTLVDKYINELDLNENEQFISEQVFYLPISKDLSIGFTVDLLRWVSTKQYNIIEDNKFTSRKWSEKKLSRYCQTRLYHAFMEQLHHPVARSYVRFFNTATGGFSYKKYEPGQTELDNMFSEFKTVATELAEFKSKPVAQQREEAIRTINYMTCQWCDFTYPCDLELQGKDASKTLAYEYAQRKYGYEE